MRSFSLVICMFCLMPSVAITFEEDNDFLIRPPPSMETEGTVDTVTGDGDTYYEEQTDDGDWYYGALGIIKN
jgi:hypothetical protein